jgi:uncharacterized membrane protein YdbT with pleckstrin-like domain
MAETPGSKRYKPHFLFAPIKNLFSTRVLEISPNRVAYITGMFDKDERSIPINKITDVTISQGLLGAMFGARNLTIQTAGSDQAELTVQNLGRGREARDLILKYIADAK